MAMATKRRRSNLTARIASAIVCALAYQMIAIAQLASNELESRVQPLRASPPQTAPGQSATLLPDGRWLLLGGEAPDRGSIATAVLLDAGSGQRTILFDSLTYARSGHTATVLPDGSVLILGGEGVDGHIVATPEAFDPRTEAFHSVAGLDLLPRQLHTATLLTDGRLLIVGGLDDDGNVIVEVELLDTFTGNLERFDAGIETPRFGHLAALLPSAPVLIWGGLDDQDSAAANAQLFEPQFDNFAPIDATTRGYLPDPMVALATPSVTGVYPDPTDEIGVDSILTLRFSKPLDVTTLTAETVTLFGPTGATGAHITGAEAGLLLFVAPEQALTPGAYYTLFVNGARDTAALSLPFTSVRFHTQIVRATNGPPGTHPGGSAIQYSGLTTATNLEGHTHTEQSTSSPAEPRLKALIQGEDDEMWIPGPEALRGHWRSKRVSGPPQLRALASVDRLQAAPGQTAVTGQVLRLNGKPLVNATVRMNDQVAGTDGLGRFILANVQEGWQRLSVDGSTANRSDAQYGRHDMRVYVTAGRTNSLVWTVWLPKLDTAHAVHVDSPTQHDTIVSSPHIPGLELRIPAGTVIRDRAGNIVTELTITPVPLDQTAHPLPEGGFPVYFTLQPSGVRFESADGSVNRGVRLRYPNYDSLLKPGSPANFWSYDPDGIGWQIYAYGTVTPDNFIEMAADDANGFRVWEDGGHSGGPPPGPPGPNPCPSETCCQGGAPPDDPSPNPGPPDGGPGGGDRPGSGPPGSDDAGDPCSVTTGQFTLASRDLNIHDVMSFSVKRIYRPNDARPREFGIGTTWPFGMYVSGGEGLTSHPLVMANGSRIYFDNVNGNTGHGGIFVNTTAPGPFFGAVLTIVGSPELFTVLRKDGTLYTFDASGNLIEIRSRQGAAITITRSGSQVIVASPSGRYLALTYNSSGFISQIQDHAGRSVSYAYTSNRLTSVTNANGDVWAYTYDANGRMKTIVDPRHNTMVTNTYDANGRIANQTYADGTTTQFAYALDTNGNVMQTDVRDRKGSVRRVQIDGSGHIQQEMFPLGAPEQQTVTFTRDPTSHLLTSKTDALNRRTDWTYDAQGNALSVTRLAGTVNAVTTTYTYEPTFSQIASLTDPLGHTTTFAYDGAGNVAQVTDALGHAITLTYNDQGQPLTITNALGQSRTFTYDAGVLATATDSLNHTTTIFSDAASRAVRITDSSGNQMGTTYDALDRITEVVDSLGNSVTFEYDPNSNLTAHVDKKGNRTVYTYDAMNRLIGRQDPLHQSASYVYEPSSSLLKQVADRMGQVTGYSSDALGRRTQVGFGATPTNPTAYTSTVAYAYDAANRLVTADDSANGAITRSYDDLDRLVQETTPFGTVSYTYYANGLRQTMTVSGQPMVTYTYDNANRQTSIAQGSLMVGFTYDNANRRTQVTLPNGIAINYGYDAASQVSTIGYVKGASTLGDLTYFHDGTGRRFGGSFARTDLPPAIATASHNADNQLTQWGGATLAYDANGNLLSDGTYAYAWNSRNQLVQVTQGGNTIANYRYDAFGRRTEKVISGVTTRFVYDGLNFVQERDQANVVTADVLTGLRVDEVYARTKGANTSSFLMDAIGTIIAEADTNGVIQTSYSYDPYGRTTQTGVTSDNAQRYAGREQDTADLYFYRSRYYSPTFGRFISEDPLGLRAGFNGYGYARNNPLRYTDPLGLFPACGSAIQDFRVYDYQETDETLLWSVRFYGPGPLKGIGPGPPFLPPEPPFYIPIEPEPIFDWILYEMDRVRDDIYQVHEVVTQLLAWCTWKDKCGKEETFWSESTQDDKTRTLIDTEYKFKIFKVDESFAGIPGY